MTAKVYHSATFCVTGPTSSGKTVWVTKLIRHRQDVFVEPPERILWCYGQYQPAYEELSRDLPSVQFVEGLPDDWTGIIDPKFRNLVILDDLMQECGNDCQISKLFTQGSHHCNLSVVYIVQNLFHQSKESRTISLNCHYIVLFKNPRDRSQIVHLAKQMYPGQTKFMVEAYTDATRQPYSYLFIDLNLNCPEEYRLRTNIFPGEEMFAYVPK